MSGTFWITEFKVDPTFTCDIYVRRIKLLINQTLNPNSRLVGFQNMTNFEMFISGENKTNKQT